MKVYFVRHGESVSNAIKIRQGPDAPLSDKGRKQAEFVADRFTRIKINTIIASPYERAKETAEIIQKKINKPLRFCDLAIERKPPSEVIGKTNNDPGIQEILRQAYEDGWRNGGPKYSDEENFEEFVVRVEQFLSFIANHREENIAVVSHGMFI